MPCAKCSSCGQPSDSPNESCTRRFPNGNTCTGVFKSHFHWKECGVCKGTARVEREGRTWECDKCLGGWNALSPLP